MGELIRYKKQGGIVGLEINVVAEVPWKYTYIEENRGGKITADSTKPPKYPQKHVLGYPEEMELDHNHWDIFFVNVGTGNYYSITLRWYQEGNSEPLYTWSKEGESNEDEGVPLITLTGSVRFLGV